MQTAILLRQIEKLLETHAAKLQRLSTAASASTTPAKKSVPTKKSAAKKLPPKKSVTKKAVAKKSAAKKPRR
jgi:hypothetical protein